MRQVIILFGEMGCGKTYWGERLAKACGKPFFDGDTVITPEMSERVSRFRLPSKPMLDDYVLNHLAPTILSAVFPLHAPESEGLVVAQALYLKEHRRVLKDYLERNGCRVFFWQMWCPFWQNLKQLWSRQNGLWWVLYWLLNKPFFQSDAVIYRGGGLDWLSDQKWEW